MGASTCVTISIKFIPHVCTQDDLEVGLRLARGGDAQQLGINCSCGLKCKLECHCKQASGSSTSLAVQNIFTSFESDATFYNALHGKTYLAAGMSIYPPSFFLTLKAVTTSVPLVLHPLSNSDIQQECKSCIGFAPYMHCLNPLIKIVCVSFGQSVCVPMEHGRPIS